MSALRAAWAAGTAGQRAAIAIVAVILASVLYGAFAYSLDRSRTQMRENVIALRAQAATLERQAAEIARLRTSRVPPQAGGDLRAQVVAAARVAGLAEGELKADARGADEVQMTLASVPFASWLAWAAALQSQHIRVATCRIEALATPGVVAVTATLVRSPVQ